MEILAQFVTNVFAFLLLLAIMKKFVWGNLLLAIDARRNKIASDFESIEQSKVDMARLKTQYEQELAKIEEAARKKMLEAVNEGRKMAGEIEETARSKAQEHLNKAKETLELEVAKAKEELKAQMVDLTVSAAEKILRSRLDAAKDRAIVEGFIAELEGSASKKRPVEIASK